MIPRVMPMQDLTRPQDVSGVAPMFQNIGNQQAMQNAAMQQGMGLMQQAGQRPQGGMNPMLMAQMLRGTQGTPYLSSLYNMARYGSGNVYGGFGQGQVPTQITGQDQYEPVKNMPSVGAYGQLIPSN